MSNPYGEDILIVKLREGLYEAIQDSSSVDVTDLDSITFQKLLLKAIDHLGLREDITIQWYLDGELIGNESAKRGKFGQKDQLTLTNEFHLSNTPSVERIAEFYLSMENPSFDEFVHQSTFKYLREYYQESEQIPYRDLYLSNLDIDQALTQAADQLRDDDLTEDIGKTVRQRCQEFKLELLLYEEFSDVMPYESVFERAAVSIANWVVEANERKEADYDLDDTITPVDLNKFTKSHDDFIMLIRYLL